MWLQVLGKVKKHVKRCITCIAGPKEDHKSFTNGTVICTLTALLYPLIWSATITTHYNSNLKINKGDMPD